MNTRIQELARKSHIDVYGLGKDYTKWETCLEKFAELIVRECAKSIENTIETDCMSFFPAQACALAKIMMLAHFGVEE